MENLFEYFVHNRKSKYCRIIYTILPYINVDIKILNILKMIIEEFEAWTFNISWYGTSTRPDGIWNKTYSVVSLFLPPWEDESSECRDDEDQGGERGWKGALGNARVKLGARGGIIKEAGNAKEAVTLSVLYVSSVWPRMRSRLSLQFSRLGRQLRSLVLFSLLHADGSSLSLLSSTTKETPSERIRRSIPSRGIFKCHQPAISEVGLASTSLGDGSRSLVGSATRWPLTLKKSFQKKREKVPWDLKNLSSFMNFFFFFLTRSYELLHKLSKACYKIYSI